MLSIETRDGLSQPEKETLFGWSDDPWDNNRYGLTWTGTDVRFLGLEDGKPVTHSGLYFHSIDMGGREMTLAGLNSVITVPHARGKGYGGQIVGAAEDYMSEERPVDFGMLFCHPELQAFYGPRGWRAIDGPVTIDQPEGKRQTPHVVMVFPIADDTWPEGPVILNSYPW